MLCISIYQKKSSLIISTWKIKLYLTLPMMLDHVYIYVYIFYPHIFNLLFNQKKTDKTSSYTMFHGPIVMDQSSESLFSTIYVYIYNIHILYIYIIRITHILYIYYYTYIYLKIHTMQRVNYRVTHKEKTL